MHFGTQACQVVPALYGIQEIVPLPETEVNSSPACNGNKMSGAWENCPCIKQLQAKIYSFSLTLLFDNFHDLKNRWVPKYWIWSVKWKVIKTLKVCLKDPSFEQASLFMSSLVSFRKRKTNFTRFAATMSPENCWKQLCANPLRREHPQSLPLNFIKFPCNTAGLISLALALEVLPRNGRAGSEVATNASSSDNTVMSSFKLWLLEAAWLRSCSFTMSAATIAAFTTPKEASSSSDSPVMSALTLTFSSTRPTLTIN